jgi:NAD(P)H-hydrate epimerase
MKIINAQQMKAVDAFTIQNKPISSIDLMEKAAEECSKWIMAHFDNRYDFHVFCGTGNNGGDGLAIARILKQKLYPVTVYIKKSDSYSEDFESNLELWQDNKGRTVTLEKNTDFNFQFNENSIIIDALLGYGLNRPLAGFEAALVKSINSLHHKTISIDLPSGLFANDNSNNTYDTIINADYTLTFELQKLALLLPDNQTKSGEVVILPIGLLKESINQQETNYHFTTFSDCKAIYKPKPKFAHKGTNGHALIIAGSLGKMGAAILSSKACLKSGSGLVTAFIPKIGNNVLQIANPEIMTLFSADENTIAGTIETHFEAVGIGPGIGKAPETLETLKYILLHCDKPLVLDADALNLLAEHPELRKSIPINSIITPHPKELSRWIGSWKNDTEKIEKVLKLVDQFKIYVVLKGAYTCIFCPDGTLHFNSSGNPGMATAGSGDVLTGILTGLLAQGYTAKESCLLGVYLHGLAGDLAAKEKSQESLIASDIIEFLGKAYLQLNLIS